MIYSDSILKCSKLNKKKKFKFLLEKKLKKILRKKQKVLSKGITGATSRIALINFEKIISKHKDQLLILQFGINDSWHYKSLKGHPNISRKNFKINLLKIFRKCIKFRLNKIYFLTYHKLLKNRIEFNNKSVNENLQKYNSIIRNTFRKNSFVQVIDIAKLTKKISPKNICINEPDGVHLNEKGSLTYAKLVFNNIKKNFV